MTKKNLIGWRKNLDGVISQAIERFTLRNLGWRGFEALPWVVEIKERYPELGKLAEIASSHNPDAFIAPVNALFKTAPAADHPAIQSFFIGKLALEELSCRLNGAGAGACDKRAAYIEIWQISKEYVAA